MTLTTQFYTLIAMIGMGSYFGATLDTYQLFLKRTQRKRWLVFIHDILFWLVQSLQVFYVLLLVNQGELRFYSFLALICGFAAYQALFKDGYLILLKAVIAFCKATATFIKRVISLLIISPVVGVIKLLLITIRTLIKGLFSIVHLIFRVIMVVIKVICTPFVWTIGRIYKLLPESVTNKTDKLYNNSKGFFVKTWNKIYTVIVSFKNKR